MWRVFVHGAMRALVVLLLLVPLVAASVPAAQAQQGPTAQVALTVVDPAQAFLPGSEATLDVYGRYIVRNAAGEPLPDLEGNGQRQTRIAFSVKQMPSWVVSATVEPPTLLVDPPVPGASNGQSPFGGVVVRLNVSPDAPALQREDIIVEAVAEANGAIPEARGESPSIKLRAAEVALANVTGPESPHVIDGGRWNTVTFTVRNDGNKDTKFLLNVTVRPEFSEVEFPQEIELAVGESQPVDVRVRTPWTERETGTLQFEATPLMEDDEGPSSSYALDVVGESAVPSAPPLLLVALALLAARGLRRGT